MRLQYSGILFLHYHYPPIKNSGVYRNYFLSHALLRYIDNTYLFTTSNQNILPNEELPISNKIHLQVIPTFDYRTLVSYFGKTRKTNLGNQFSETSKSSFFFQKLIQFQRSFPFNIFFAEGSIIYILFAFFKAIPLIKNKKINIVYSSFMPYADHIIAWMLKKRFPHLIWVADFRDLHVEPIYKNVLWPKFQQKVEKYLLQKADIITTVSEGISKKMSELHQNVHTITKGVDLREPQDLFDKFTIHYSGSLFRDFRNPKPLLSAISQLLQSKEILSDDITFLYAGKDEATLRTWVQEYDLMEIFDSRGLIDRNPAIEMQNKSHINLLLTSASLEHTGLLTGKLFEYIEAGREILCLINGAKDSEIENLFQKYKLGVVAYNENNIKEYIQHKYNEWKMTGSVKSYHDKEGLKNNLSWDIQAKKLYNIICNR